MAASNVYGSQRKIMTVKTVVDELPQNLKTLLSNALNKALFYRFSNKLENFVD